MRPEKLDLQLSAGEGFLEGQIEETIYLGAATRVLVQLNSGKRLTVLQQTTSGDSVDLSRGKKVWVRLDANELVKLGA